MMLSAMGQGHPLGEAIASGFLQSRIPEHRRTGLVRTWFAEWAALGWICAPDIETIVQS